MWSPQRVASQKEIIKWLADEVIDINNLGLSTPAAIAGAVAPGILLKIEAGMSAFATEFTQAFIGIVLNSFKTKCINELGMCAYKAADLDVAAGEKIAVMMKYKWTTKDGGNWMPQYEMKVLVVQTA